MIRTTQRLDGRVLHILLDAPKANVLDHAMVSGISEALTTEVSPATRLIVFEGSGRHFCFGASVAEHTREEAPGMLATFHAMFRKLAEVAVPTCAVVRGQCLGGGLELASWCSWIVCTPDAHLGQPEIRLAVFPPMGSILLPWRAGGRAALDLCVSGRVLTAQEALELGIVNAVTDEPEQWWMARFEAELAPTSATSLRFAERAARVVLNQQLDTLLPELERLYLDELMATHDANEGISAFIERRPPAFTNA